MQQSYARCSAYPSIVGRRQIGYLLLPTRLDEVGARLEVPSEALRSRLITSAEIRYAWPVRVGAV